MLARSISSQNFYFTTKPAQKKPFLRAGSGNLRPQINSNGFSSSTDEINKKFMTSGSAMRIHTTSLPSLETTKKSLLNLKRNQRKSPEKSEQKPAFSVNNLLKRVKQKKKSLMFQAKVPRQPLINYGSQYGHTLNTEASEEAHKVSLAPNKDGSLTFQSKSYEKTKTVTQRFKSSNRDSSPHNIDILTSPSSGQVQKALTSLLKSGLENNQEQKSMRIVKILEIQSDKSDSRKQTKKKNSNDEKEMQQFDQKMLERSNFQKEFLKIDQNAEDRRHTLKPKRKPNQEQDLPILERLGTPVSCRNPYDIQNRSNDKNDSSRRKDQSLLYVSPEPQKIIRRGLNEIQLSNLDESSGNTLNESQNFERLMKREEDSNTRRSTFLKFKFGMPEKPSSACNASGTSSRSSAQMKEMPSDMQITQFEQTYSVAGELFSQSKLPSIRPSQVQQELVNDKKQQSIQQQDLTKALKKQQGEQKLPKINRIRKVKKPKKLLFGEHQSKSPQHRKNSPSGEIRESQQTAKAMETSQQLQRNQSILTSHKQSQPHLLGIQISKSGKFEPDFQPEEEKQMVIKTTGSESSSCGDYDRQAEQVQYENMRQLTNTTKQSVIKTDIFKELKLSSAIEKVEKAKTEYLKQELTSCFIELSSVLQDQGKHSLNPTEMKKDQLIVRQISKKNLHIRFPLEEKQNCTLNVDISIWLQKTRQDEESETDRTNNQNKYNLPLGFTMITSLNSEEPTIYSGDIKYFQDRGKFSYKVPKNNKNEFLFMTISVEENVLVQIEASLEVPIKPQDVKTTKESGLLQKFSNAKHSFISQKKHESGLQETQSENSSRISSDKKVSQHSKQQSDLKLDLKFLSSKSLVKGSSHELSNQINFLSLEEIKHAKNKQHALSELIQSRVRKVEESNMYKMQFESQYLDILIRKKEAQEVQKTVKDNFVQKNIESQVQQSTILKLSKVKENNKRCKERTSDALKMRKNAETIKLVKFMLKQREKDVIQLQVEEFRYELRLRKALKEFITNVKVHSIMKQFIIKLEEAKLARDKKIREYMMMYKVVLHMKKFFKQHYPNGFNSALVAKQRTQCSMSLYHMLTKDNEEKRAGRMIAKFLQSTNQVIILKTKIIQTTKRCLKLLDRGKLISCMNKVRLELLSRLWDEQHFQLIKKLKRSRKLDRKKKLKRLHAINSEIKECALKQYYHFCVQEQSVKFITWHRKDVENQKDIELRKMLRLQRLLNSQKYDIEDQILRINQFEPDQKAAMEQMIELEMQIQKKRKVPKQTNLLDITINSNAAAFYAAAWKSQNLQAMPSSGASDATRGNNRLISPRNMTLKKNATPMKRDKSQLRLSKTMLKKPDKFQSSAALISRLETKKSNLQKKNTIVDKAQMQRSGTQDFQASPTSRSRSSKRNRLKINVSNVKGDNIDRSATTLIEKAKNNLNPLVMKPVVINQIRVQRLSRPSSNLNSTAERQKLVLSQKNQSAGNGGSNRVIQKQETKRSLISDSSISVMSKRQDKNSLFLSNRVLAQRKRKGSSLSVNQRDIKSDDDYNDVKNSLEEDEESIESEWKIKLRNKLHDSNVQVTEEMAYPPTISYIPTEQLMREIILKATKAKLFEVEDIPKTGYMANQRYQVLP